MNTIAEARNAANDLITDLIKGRPSYYSKFENWVADQIVVTLRKLQEDFANGVYDGEMLKKFGVKNELLA